MCNCKINNNNIYLPKIGWVSFRKSREIEGKIKNVTISKKKVLIDMFLFKQKSK